MAQEQTPWTEKSGRHWLSWAPIWDLKAVFVRGKRLTWHEGRELAPEYAGLTSRPQKCLADAWAMRDEYPELRVVSGYSFRARESTRGVFHFWTIDPDGAVVDLAAQRVGRADGYLGYLPTEADLQQPAADNGLIPGPEDDLRGPSSPLDALSAQDGPKSLQGELQRAMEEGRTR